MNQESSTATKKEKVILMADYGRSGQGWLSYMLCYILNAKYIEPYDFLKGMLYTTNQNVLDATGGNLPNREKSGYSMVIKTHHYPALNLNLTDKIIFLIRDPRDIAVSAYYRYKVLKHEEPPHSLKEWLFYLLHGLRPLSYAFTAYKWKKFIRLWTERKDIPFHKVSYEDVSQNTDSALRRILAYLNVPVNDGIIKEAIEKFGFENLSGRKKGEESTGSMPFRKGIIGDYKNKFSYPELALFSVIAGGELKKMGYEA